MNKYWLIVCYQIGEDEALAELCSWFDIKAGEFIEVDAWCGKCLNRHLSPQSRFTKHRS